MPMKGARICGCGRRVAGGMACECQRKRAAEREQQRPSARERGYSSKWERESKAFLALPENRMCACGCGRVAECVDHIIAHKGDQRLFWSRTNWRPMALACNSRKNALFEGGFGRIARTSFHHTQVEPEGFSKHEKSIDINEMGAGGHRRLLAGVKGPRGDTHLRDSRIEQTE